MNDIVEELFTKRERGLIYNCTLYAQTNPSGLPGHNLMIIICKLHELVDRYYTNSSDDEDAAIIEVLKEQSLWQQ